MSVLFQLSFIATFFFLQNNWAQKKVGVQPTNSTRTEFQKEILLCLPDLKKIEGLKSFDGLLGSIDSQYLIITEQNVYREVLFEKESKSRKLKLTRDHLELFNIDAEGRLDPMEVEVAGKGKSTSRVIGQILHRAKVLSDWQKTLQTREGSMSIELVRKDSSVVQMLIESRSLKRKLDCNSVDNSQICICHK